MSPKRVKVAEDIELEKLKEKSVCPECGKKIRLELIRVFAGVIPDEFLKFKNHRKHKWFVWEELCRGSFTTPKLSTNN